MAVWQVADSFARLARMHGPSLPSPGVMPGQRATKSAWHACIIAARLGNRGAGAGVGEGVAFGIWPDGADGGAAGLITFWANAPPLNAAAAAIKIIRRIGYSFMLKARGVVDCSMRRRMIPFAHRHFGASASDRRHAKDGRFVLGEWHARWFGRVAG